MGAVWCSGAQPALHLEAGPCFDKKTTLETAKVPSGLSPVKLVEMLVRSYAQIISKLPEDIESDLAH